MERVELLTVAERFQASRVGLVLVPDFPVPRGGWRSISETVTVVLPDGREYETAAEFNMAHFNISAPNVPIEERWRIVVSLPEVTKEEVPIGSRILVSHQVRDAVLVGNEQG